MKQEYVFREGTVGRTCKGGKNEIDITGKRFGHLVALRRTGTYIPPSGMKVPIWLFKCDCGKEVEMNKGMVLKGSATSCGCMKKAITPNEYYIEGDVMHVICRTGEFIVDAADKDYILQHHWGITKQGYVFNRKHDVLHKQLMPTETGIVDHINRNKLDNRRCNLRVVNYTVNNINKEVFSNTGLYGISKTKHADGFVVYVLHKYVGYFKTLDEAIEARNQHPLYAKVVEIRGDSV